MQEENISFYYTSIFMEDQQSINTMVLEYNIYFQIKMYILVYWKLFIFLKKEKIQNTFSLEFVN